MRRSRSTELIEPDSKIDRTFRRLLKERRDRKKVMAEQNQRKALRDYDVSSLSGDNSCNIAPII